jgi:hypothetical protein
MDAVTALLVSISLDEYDDCAIVRFPYNPHLVEIIRCIPTRQWHKDLRAWSIPFGEVNGCAVIFSEEGCTVTVDGDLWVPPTIELPVPANRVDLIERLFEVIPDYLVQATHRALIRVWHPDQGGDHPLAQDLNEVWSRSPKGLT